MYIFPGYLLRLHDCFHTILLVSCVLILVSDNASLDASSHRGANPSIGEASLSLVSGSQVLRLGQEADRESASNVAVAGSVTSNTPAPACQRLEVQADVASAQRFSMSSETASQSLSEDAACVAPDHDQASTRALAGSMLNYCKVSELLHNLLEAVLSSSQKP